MVRPWKHVYDGIPVHHFVKEWIRNADRRFGDLPNGSPEPFTLSFNELYEAIDGGKNEISRTTASNHFKKKVQDGTFHKHRKDGKRRYEYRLCTQKLIAYLEYLDTCYLRSSSKTYDPPRRLLPLVNPDDFESCRSNTCSYIPLALLVTPLIQRGGVNSNSS